jgi:serine transporter
MKMSSKDWGWVAVNIGMGIGAGIVFLPIQAGLVGLWTFLLAIFLAYPALYLFQRLYINTLIESRDASDYTSTIREYLGSKWGASLGVVYFVMLLIWLFVYSETVTNDSATYIREAGLTQGLLSGNHLYALVLIGFLVFLAFASKTLLFHLSKVLVVVTLSSLVVLAVLIAPHWDIKNIKDVSSIWDMLCQTVITLPFAMTSILFLQSLSPMVVYVRSEYEDVAVARKKALQIMNRAFLILAGVVFFFALSCTLAMTHKEAYQAFVDNTSFLALMAKAVPGTLVPALGVMIDISAVTTSFFGVLLGLHEACVGLYMNLFLGDRPKEAVNMKKVSAGIVGLIVLLGWIATIIDFPILYFTSICSPIFAIIGCFIPVLLVYKADSLAKYRGPQAWIIVATGVLLVLSPLFALVEN